MSKKISEFDEVLGILPSTFIPIIQGLPLDDYKITPEILVAGTQVVSDLVSDTVTNTQSIVDINTEIDSITLQIGDITNEISNIPIDVYTKTETDNLLDGKSDSNHLHTGVYQPIMGSNDNYVTDDQITSINTIGNKVDKVSGKELYSDGQADTRAALRFTDSEKTKLAGIESNKFVGQFTSEAALFLVVGTQGQYAYVDLGIGQDVAAYAWDTNDNKWVLQKGITTAETSATIKVKYESNPDTNAFTDGLKTKLNGISSGAQVNVIETIQKNGVTLSPTSKTVNITVPTQASDISAEPANANIQSHISDTTTRHLNATSQTIGGVKTFTDGIITNHVEYDTTPSIPTSLSSTYWDAANRTLSTILGNGVVLQHGQEMYVKVVNKTGVDITDGSVVYINGAQGNRPTVALAIANSENTSYVIGVVTETILINQEGLVTVFGQVSGFNTSTYTDGAKLYLSSTNAGQLTTTKPIAPNHSVVVGIALNSTNNGSIFIHPTDGYELGELHDVDLTKTKTTPIDADYILIQDSADSNIWKKLSWSNNKSTLQSTFAKLSGGNTFLGTQNLTNSNADNLTNVLEIDNFSGVLKASINGNGSYENIADYGSNEAPLVYDASNWTLTSGWVFAGNFLDKSSAGTTTATALLGVAPVAQQVYKMTFTVGDSIGGGAFVGNVTPSFAGTAFNAISAKGTYTYYIHAVSTAKLVFTPSTTGARFSITDISVVKRTDLTADVTVGGDVFFSGNRILNRNTNTPIMYWYPNGNTYLTGALSCASTATISSSLTVSSSISETRTNNHNIPQQGIRGNCSTSATAALPSQVSTSLELYGNSWDSANRSQFWHQYVDNIYHATVGRSRYKFNYGYNTTTAALAKEQMGLDSNGTLSIMGDAVSTSENLTNGALTSGTSWAVTGDFALTGNAAGATFSTGSGTLTQTQANLAVAAVGGVWYSFTYTVSNPNSTHYMYIGTEFAQERVYLGTTTAGTYVTKFKSAITPTDFKIYYIGSAGTVVNLDTFSLKRCDGGKLEVANTISIGGNIVMDKASGKGIQVDLATPTYPWFDLLGEITVRQGGASVPTFAAYRGGIYQYSFGTTGGVTEIFNNFHIPHDHVPNSDLYLHLHSSTAAAPTGIGNWLFEVTYAKGHNQAAFPTTLTVIPVVRTYVTAYQHYIDEVQLSAAGGVIASAINVSITSGAATLTSASSLFTSADIGRSIRITGAGVAGGNLDTTITAYTSATSVTVGNNASTTVTSQPNFKYLVLDTASIEPDGLVLVRTWRDSARTADTLDVAPFVHFVDIHYQSTGIGTKQKAPNFYV